jgi:hypothetical protein
MSIFVTSLSNKISWTTIKGEWSVYEWKTDKTTKERNKFTVIVRDSDHPLSIFDGQISRNHIKYLYSIFHHIDLVDIYKMNSLKYKEVVPIKFQGEILNKIEK